MRWFDTHCHLDRLDDPAGELRRARERGVGRLLVPSLSGRPRSLPAAAGVCYGVGWHPLFLPADDETFLGSLDTLDVALRTDARCVGVGEIGLDYHQRGAPRDRQRRALEAQLEVAASAGAPVVVHLRKGYGDFLAIARRFAGLRFVMHGFSGSADYARALLHHLDGVWFGFGATTLRANAKRAWDALDVVPMDRVVLETDAPDQTPRPLPPPNTPANLPFIGERIAARRGGSAAELAERTWQNACAAFGLPIEEEEDRP